jgi:hypothetical protein
MNLLTQAKRESAAALKRVNFIERTTKLAKDSGYSSLQAALADLAAIPTVPSKNKGSATPLGAKNRASRPAKVTKEQVAAALKAGLTGSAIAKKFGRTLSWLNKRKAEWRLSSRRK